MSDLEEIEEGEHGDAPVSKTRLAVEQIAVEQISEQEVPLDLTPQIPLVESLQQIAKNQHSGSALGSEDLIDQVEQFAGGIQKEIDLLAEEIAIKTARRRKAMELWASLQKFLQEADEEAEQGSD